MAVTLTDIAEETGVSVSTVSRVLNDKANEYRISEDTRELILRTAQRLNYRPNNLARNLRLSRTQSLGLVVPDVANPFFASLTKHVHTVAHELGYSLFVCNTDEDVALEVEHVGLLHRNRVDGLIAMPVGRESAHFKELHRRGIPLVLLDRGFDDLDVSTVLVDNYQGAYDAVAHLIAQPYLWLFNIIGKCLDAANSLIDILKCLHPVRSGYQLDQYFAGMLDNIGVQYRADDVYIALGTTIKVAGSEAAFRRVERVC